MENNTWTYISALGSVGFGWLLNETGQWLRARKENKISRRVVLYNLLEIHHTFNRLDMKNMIEEVTELLLKKIPKEEQSQELKNYLVTFYSQALQKIAEDNVTETLNKLEKDYTKSIDDFSKVDPIRAYKLKGKNRIMETFDLFNKYFNHLKDDFPNDAKGIEYASAEVIKELRPDLITDAIKDIEEELKEISLSIGFFARYKVNKIITKTHEVLDAESKIKAEAIMDNLFRVFESNPL